MTDTLPASVPATTAAKPQMVATRPTKADLLQFGTIAEVMKFAEMIQHAEGAIPKHCIAKPGKILATVMAGHELGVGPMASLRAFHVVEGKPTADYSFWVARLKAAGYRVEWPERSQERVTLKLTAPDGSSATETWDKARAITAGLWNGKDNWKKYPMAMLSARCVTSLGRAFAGEVMFGCYEHDEADEILKEADVVAIEGVPQKGTVAERVAAVTGAAIDAEAKAREAKASECANMAKALGLTREQVFALMTEIGAQPGRISELSREHLDALAEKLDEHSRGEVSTSEPCKGIEER
ncbi:MAG: hypothetical protein JNL12_22275 [Planctomycetes bacterium]|nr:hypothetical protein [Planctomycetota bacterium]